jgi:hypothetical protein
MATPLLTPLYWFADQGCTFVLVHPRSKQPVQWGWPDHPVGVDDATKHIRRGGNIGILLGAPSQNVVCLDLDQHFPLACDLYPELARIRITRPGAPDRGKLLLRLEAPLVRPFLTRKWAFFDGAAPTTEFLAHRAQAVIPPSIHPAGGAYELHRTASAIPLCSPLQLASVWEVLTADTFAWYNQPHQPHRQPWNPDLFRESVRSRSLPVRHPTIDITSTRTALYARFDSALAVFHHFGHARKMQPAGQGNIRLLGNGGLIVGNPASAGGWRWYCFRDGVGGDVVDAVGYCLMGKAWNRHSPQNWLYLQICSKA